MARVVKRPTAVEQPVAAPVIDWPVPKTKTFDLDLLRGAKRQPFVLGVDASATAPAIAAFGLDDLTAFVWVAYPETKGVRRLVDIESWAQRTLVQIKLRCETIEHIAMENYSFASVAEREKMGEVGGTVKRELLRVFGARNKVAYPTLVAPTALKKFVVGSGGSSKNPVKKQHMLLAAFKKWGVDLDEDNACDAYGLARVAHSLHTGVCEFEYEKEVISKLVPHTEWPEQEV